MKIKDVLMRRDGLTSEEADEVIAEAKEAIHSYIDCGDYESAEEVCYEYFQLEPDYLMELIDL